MAKNVVKAEVTYHRLVWVADAAASTTTVARA
jgi:hypothetical protein